MECGGEVHHFRSTSRTEWVICINNAMFSIFCQTLLSVWWRYYVERGVWGERSFQVNAWNDRSNKAKIQQGGSVCQDTQTEREERGGCYWRAWDNADFLQMALLSDFWVLLGGWSVGNSTQFCISSPSGGRKIAHMFSVLGSKSGAQPRLWRYIQYALMNLSCFWRRESLIQGFSAK